MRLSDLYPTLTAEQRRALADKVGTEPAYLWQLATRWRDKRPSIDLMQRLSNADKRLRLNDLVDEFAKKRRPTATSAQEATHG